MKLANYSTASTEYLEIISFFVWLVNPSVREPMRWSRQQMGPRRRRPLDWRRSIGGRHGRAKVATKWQWQKSRSTCAAPSRSASTASRSRWLTTPTSSTTRCRPFRSQGPPRWGLEGWLLLSAVSRSRQPHWRIDSRYNLERKIFQQLLELKQMQIVTPPQLGRIGYTSEQVNAKRLIESFRKDSVTVGLRPYDGGYSFAELETYLYGNLISSATKGIFIFFFFY